MCLPSMVGCSDVFARARTDAETVMLLAAEVVELVFPVSVLEHQLVSSEHGRMFRCLDPSKVGYRDLGAVLCCGRHGAPIVSSEHGQMFPKSSSEQGRIPRPRSSWLLRCWS